tara:strand:- start:1449 stop:2123 length:675 start_codon:yes stop_codon:yes gene_type:complete
MSSNGNSGSSGGNGKGRDLDYQQSGGKKGSTFQTYKDGKAVGVDYALKNKIENQKEQKFIESGAKKIDKTKLIGSLGIFKEPFKKGSISTRTYFSEKVLSSSKAKKNIGYTKSEFRNLSLAEQNRVYAGYLEGRMSGGTDAYGNVKTGWSKDSSNNWQETGGNNTPQRKTEAQIEAESESEIKKDDVAISEDEYKKRRGLVGSRSMFSRSGGRGFFDSTGSAIM